MLKLIATDMDGTFLRSDHSYDEKLFAKVYQKMINNHIQFVVASGNQYYLLKRFFKNYPDIIYIAENGALIRDTEQIYNIQSFSNEVVDTILFKLSLIPNLRILVCGRDSAYTTEATEFDYIENLKHYYHRLVVVDNYSGIKDEILKFALTCPPEKTDELMEQLKISLSGIAEPTSSGHGSIDIIQPGTNKAFALQNLGEILNIKMSEMCAFGDGGNDLEMLREVGLGVAMKNAYPHVSKVVTQHTLQTNEEQGVLKYIDNLLD
ncbi:haloacid dehalogenase [Companilactobacillus sp. RD055328]|uniref:Cof-type HAD-IIB family hydrolase n=1 Tax=Companilactobacillus sp. RD055328 TaxID=2916634 RepID=UPI001FC817EC|nr:Cof-type HAD-IIB family hydrolase [Companilactobacillus sp. RD055328]GKQ42208.1 haloacid dehalogenase [Companilactobacillus sp. RD055328]